MYVEIQVINRVNNIGYIHPVNNVNALYPPFKKLFPHKKILLIEPTTPKKKDKEIKKIVIVL
jgi:hypothetical protein